MNAIRRVIFVVTLIGIAASAGCMVGPDYRRPRAQVPQQYKEATITGVTWKTAAPSDELDPRSWWSIYQDPLLDDLAKQIQCSNQSLKGFAAAYRQALALSYAARSTLLPELSLTPRAARGRAAGVTSTTRSLEVGASWDLDLWGKTRREVQSKRAAAQASAAQLGAARLSLEAELVSDYFQLRYADSLQALLANTVSAYQRTLDIAQNQYAAGIAARSDVVTAEAQLHTTQAQLIAAGVSRSQLEHAIALLIGETAGDLTIPVAPLTTTVPQIPLVVPSTLLERRADIAQAERTVAQQSALIGVAVAAFYPDISLSGLFGYASSAPSGGLLAASNRIWSGAVSGNQFLFDGGVRTASVVAARAAHAQSVANYRQTVLAAFEEVETCLSSLRILADQAEAQEQAVALSRRSVEISLNEYAAGIQSYTAVVTSQTAQFANEEIQLQVASNRLLQSVALLKALGGGWSADE